MLGFKRSDTGRSLHFEPLTKGPAAVDDVDGAGGVAGFVGGEVDGESGDLFGFADAADGLASDEIAAGLFDVAKRGDALLEGRRFDRAGTDGVDANCPA